MVKNWRINFVLILIFLAGGVIISRLFYLQIYQGDFYKAQARGQQNFLSETEGERGGVFFRGGEILALTKDTPYLFVSPEEIQEKEKTAAALALIINENENELLEKISVPDSLYEMVLKEMDDRLAEKVEEADLKGVYIGYKKKRYYPNEKTASQIIGFINEEGIGQYGLEEYYQDELSGETKTQKKEFNPWNFLSSLSEDDSLKGASLNLTLDYNIQFMAEKILEEGIKEFEAQGGEIVVMDPQNGEIIAMAQSPNFDPNNYENEDYAIFQNSAIQKLFEPGSIFKPITMSATLNEKLVTPETEFEDYKGYVQYGKYRVVNFSNKAWGKTTMTQILEKSINTGIIYVENLLGHAKFLEYAENYGFFNKTGVDLAGEVASENKELKKALQQKIEVTFANASFGQGINITPLQITTAFCAIANGGNLVKPHIVKEISVNGENEKIEAEILRSVITPETSLQVKKMMINVVENGFGHLGKIDGYYIAGKTGTSQVPWSSLEIDEQGYSDETWQSFIGFAPALDPKFVILVKLNSPQTKTSEYSAAPLFHDLAKYILDYWQIPPDYIEELDKTE
ncbi:MAG: penicillin-binding protein 2 [Candidatus Paceibacterota bacterium]|jgi:cell division protein FtsI/penicillin-binding protein 2|nr:penicillin-binding protein 2 [Candidatus Paceibacterota bacterium]MDD5555325.1 penicillin-binding protein 2 [Candidatus Paceibacterota bacterium]